MSFILESIKQAERERNIGQVPSITAQHALPQEEVQNNTWLKWGVVSLLVLALALFAWGATKTFQLNKAYQSHNYTQNNENAEDQIASLHVDDQAVIREENIGNKSVNEDALKNKKFSYVVGKNLHHSKLQAVQAINLQEDEFVDTPKDEALQADIVAPPSELTHKENAPEPAPVQQEEQIVKAQSTKENIYSLYSALAKTSNHGIAEKNEVVAQKIDLEHKQEIAASELIAIIEYNAIEDQSFVEDELLVANVPTLPSATAVNSGVKSFGELPYDIQQQVPDLRVSVHMFNVEPTERKIRINGYMYTEGEAMQDGLALVEITRYGAVFDYQGHAFHLNVR